jgi:hypothetical protein
MLEYEAFERRMEREYFDLLKTRPDKAHSNLDLMMRDVIVEVLNYRRAPTHLRDLCSLLFRAWDRSRLKPGRRRSLGQEPDEPMYFQQTTAPNTLTPEQLGAMLDDLREAVEGGVAP